MRRKNIFLCLIFFFLPYTSFRIINLKISEILTIILVLIELISNNLKIRKSNTMSFCFFFIATIILSAFLSFIDPINKFAFGVDYGIYYSFEYGWIFKIVRLVILYLFSEILFQNINTLKDINKFFDIYILSCATLDIYGICSMFSKYGTTFITKIGIARNALAAVEPSEAGLINCFALILCVYFIFMKTSVLRYIIFIILFAGQLCIGSTASLICFGVSITFSIIIYFFLLKKTLIRKVVYIFVFGIAVYFSLLFLLQKTNILDKVVNYRSYLQVYGSSVVERLTTMTTSFEIFKDRPFLGIGFGNFGWYVDKYVTTPFLRYTPGGFFQPNNLYMQLLCELGIIGCGLYIGYIFRMFLSIWHMISRDKFGIQKNKKAIFEITILTLLLYLVLHNLTLTTFFSFQFWIVCSAIDKLNISYLKNQNN